VQASVPRHLPGVRRVAGGLRRAAPPARRPPLPLVAAGAGVALLALVPLAYLVVRAAGVADGSLDLVFRARTAQVVANTLVLALLVGAGAVALGLPIGLLTARTDLPFRRAVTILAVVPSPCRRTFSPSPSSGCWARTGRWLGSWPPWAWSGCRPSTGSPARRSS